MRWSFALTLPRMVGGGIVVFDGIDDRGATAQVIWTPDFDLENWYAEKYSLSAEPEFYAEDINVSCNHRYVCFASEIRIKTLDGWKPAGSFRAGDLASTRDGGDVEVVRVGQRLSQATDHIALCVFAAGAIGSTLPLRLSHQHRVLIRSPYSAWKKCMCPQKPT